MLNLLRCIFLGLVVMMFLTACSGPDAKDQLWRIAVAEDERHLPLTELDEWVASPDSIVRARVAYAIGMVDQPGTRDRLATLLVDKSDTVVLAAIFASGQVADSSLQSSLLELSTSKSQAIKSRSLEALSKLGSASAAARLSETLNNSEENTSIRSLAAQWMFKLKDSASAEALIAQGLNPENLIRERVYYALARRGVREAQPLFQLGLRDSVAQIQIYSVNGLSRINDSSSSALVEPLLMSQNPRVQYHAVNYFLKFGASKVSSHLLQLTSESSDQYVQLAAIQALGTVKDKLSALTLMDLITSKDENVASEALASYAQQGRSDASTFAHLFVTDASTRKRSAAAKAFGILKGDSARSMLERMFSDSVPSVRGDALEQIFALGDPVLANRYTALALNDADYMPVAIAAGRIASERLTSFVPALCDLYSKTKHIENRQTILDVLIELADSVAEKAPIAAVKDSALLDEEFSIRKRARELAEELGVQVDVGGDHFTSNLTREEYEKVYIHAGHPRVRIETTRGSIVLELFPNAAPKTVANYLSLIKSGFYDGLVWHRVVPDFVVQDGCPRGDGWGSPGYEIRCEYNSVPFERGTLGMATSGKDTGGSQYFICQSAQPHLDGRYTVFGKVIDGIETIDQIQLGDSIRAVTILNSGETN